MTARPVAAENLFYDGCRLLREGDPSGAERAFREALKLAPQLAEVHANLGLLLDGGGRPSEAEAHYRRALQLSPQQSQTLLNFGAMLAAQKRFSEAEAHYRQALDIDHRSPAAWSNLGVLFACMKREDEAEQCYRTAISHDPGYRKARFNLAYIQLRQGRFEEGWASLEARDWYARIEGRMPCPRWAGEDLAAKSLLIAFEAGHGDMIQFCRYAALVRARGAKRVGVLCHPGLKGLFAGLTGVDEAIAFDEPLIAEWDFWAPPLSLPFLFETRIDTIPATLPYLTADAALVADWARSMESVPMDLRVGLAWKGNPRFENDSDRSLPSLNALSPLGAVTGIRFYSVQKGTGEDEAASSSASFPLIDLGPGIGDFADTAAIVMNLDLVITVDTAVAHLAGALGKPCWVLLPDYKPDWRWLKDREDSPWYPGVMRLFRQDVAGDWPTVIARLVAALQAWVEERRTAGKE